MEFTLSGPAVARPDGGKVVVLGGRGVVVPMGLAEAGMFVARATVDVEDELEEGEVAIDLALLAFASSSATAAKAMSWSFSASITALSGTAQCFSLLT